MSIKSLPGLSCLLAHRKLALSLAVGALLISSFVYLIKKRQRRLRISVQGDSHLAEVSAAECATRANNLSSVTYDIKLNLLDSGYKGSWRCSFQLKAAIPLRLDFAGKRITDFRVNHVPMLPKWEQGRVELEKVEMGHNDVEIRFEGEYADGGLCKDVNLICFFGGAGRQSLHRVIPCFDQPDVKAVFKLLVTVPRTWQVLSGDFTQSLSNFVGCCPDPDPIYDTEATEPSTLHEFFHSPRFSPEHFPLCAGLFTQFTTQAANRITVYCRPQVAHKVDLQTQLTTIMKVLEYMNTVSGVPYCFPKLDIVYLPRPQATAASVICLNESLLAADWSDGEAAQGLLEAIVSKLIAQWIGVLVTHKGAEDSAAWQQVVSDIADDYFSRKALTEGRRKAIRRALSLYKWSNCAALVAE